jgi:tetratricopeptide (TPR) repeat protein
MPKLFKIFVPVILLLQYQSLFSQENPQEYYSNRESGEPRSAVARKKEAEKAYYEGYRAFDANYLNAAIRAFDEAVRLEPAYFEAYYGRAMAKEQNNDLRGAIVDYEIVTKINSSYREAYYNRALLRYKLKDFENAIVDLNKLLELPAGNTNTVYFQGVTESEEETPTLTGISTLSNSGEIYNYRGLCRAELNDLKGAMSDFNLAIENQPENASYYYNRGNLYLKTNQKDLALADFEKTIQLNPEHKPAFHKIVAMKRDAGKNDSLEMDYYNKSIEAGKNTTSSYLSRAVVRFNKSDLTGALEDYNAAIKIDDTNSEAFINRGIVKEKLKDFEGAIKDYNQALTLKPKSVKAYSNRAKAKFKLNKFAEAALDYSKAIELDSSDASQYYNRGLAEYLSKQKIQACKDWNKALKMGYKEAADKVKEFCTDLSATPSYND